MNRAVFTEEIVEDLDIKIEKNVNKYEGKPVKRSDIYDNRYTAEEADVLNGWFIEKPEFKELYEKYYAIERAAEVNRRTNDNSYHISECMAGGLLVVFENLYLNKVEMEF